MKICTLKNTKAKNTDLDQYFSDNSVKIDPLQTYDITGKQGWFIGSPAEFSLKSKIERIGKPLKDWDVKINYGIKTGLNEAFIIDTTTKNKLCQEDPKSAEIIKSILRGRDIKRYGYEWKDLWVISSHNGYKTENNEFVEPININDYPKIKQHLDQFEPALSRRSDKGITPYNLRHCAYMSEFQKEKIVWSDISTYPCFSIVKEGLYFNNTAYMLSGFINNKIALGILNSNVIKWIFPQIGSDLGENGSRYFKQFVEQLPIPILDTPHKFQLASQIEALVEEILEIKSTTSTSTENTPTEELERQIDVLVYQLYELTVEEIAVVES
jgi:adenine-specific DNA-methyltransferase